jgi:hypothetical protein
MILILHDYDLPYDLYFWKQDRFGTLIPMLGQFFFKCLNLSAVTSESIAHYLLLIVGYIGLSSLFRTRTAKLAFALVWFLPPLRMLDILRFNFGIQYSLIGISILLMNKITGRTSVSYELKHHLFAMLVVITLGMSIWMSDLSAITVFLLLSIQFFFTAKRKLPDRNTLADPAFYYFICGVAAAACFILYAKNNTTQVAGYENINGIKEISGSVRMFFDSIFELLAFRSGDPLTGIYSWCCIIIAGAIIYKRKSIKIQDKKWLLFFATDAVAVFSVLMLAGWVFENGVARRYFVPVYISSWMIFFLIFENIQNAGFKKIAGIFILVTLLIGGLGTLYTFRYIGPRTLEPRIQVSAQLKSLGNIGIIADYWNSYINSCPDPDQIIATPYEASATVKNERMAMEVFKQKSIYVIRDMWMASFPDTLFQFKHVLIRDGNEFFLADSYICKYRDVTNDVHSGN